MEHEPDYQNVVFIDEYPHLTERRRVKQCLGQLTLAINRDPAQLLLFTTDSEATTLKEAPQDLA